MKIKKGDNVLVITGKDKGKTGKVVRVLVERGRVIVEGINIYKRHRRARKQGEKGSIVDMAVPLPVSNVALKDPKSGKPTRVGYRMEGKKKVRIARKSGSVV